MSMKGTTEFEGFTLYVTLPMVLLNPPGRVSFGPGALGFSLDLEPAGSRDFINLVLENAKDFAEHFIRSLPADSLVAGLWVWEGGALVDSEGFVEFNGDVYRPSLADMTSYMKLIEKMEGVIKEKAKEHAIHCHACARERGIDPNEVIDNSQAHIENEEVIFIPQIQGDMS